MVGNNFPLIQISDLQGGGKAWNIENGRQPGALDFFVSDGPGQVMAINQSGNVGIGTTSPLATLDVNTGTIRLAKTGVLVLGGDGNDSIVTQDAPSWLSGLTLKR